jgi:hypothetical protein
MVRRFIIQANQDCATWYFFFGPYSPQWARASSFTKFLDHTKRRTTLGRTPLDKGSARRKEPLSDNTQHPQETDTHAPGGIRTHNLKSQATADVRLRTRVHWDRHLKFFTVAY